MIWAQNEKGMVSMKIGFIGLGNIGMPMALQLVKAGFEVYGKNRSPGKEQTFIERGGKAGLSLGQLAAEMDIVITCLPMPADVEEVYLAESGLLANAREGLIVIDCSTVSTALSRRLFERSEEARAKFLDAPVSGGTAAAENGTLSIMVGGRRDVFDRVSAAGVFDAMGKNIYYVGEAGSGSAVKLINQLMVGIHTQAFSEAFALGRASNLDPDTLFTILNSSLAQSKIMERHYTLYMAKDSYDPGFAIKLLSKDLNLVAETAAASNVRLPVGGRVQSLLGRAEGEYGALDMSGMAVYQADGDRRLREEGALKHFAVFLPMLDAEKSALYREEHLRFLDERRAAGMLHANGRFVDGAGGLVIYRASSYDEVERWVRQDPYIVKGARRYEIHEWDIVLADR